MWNAPGEAQQWHMWHMWLMPPCPADLGLALEFVQPNVREITR